MNSLLLKVIATFTIALGLLAFQNCVKSKTLDHVNVGFDTSVPHIISFNKNERFKISGSDIVNINSTKIIVNVDESTISSKGGGNVALPSEYKLEILNIFAKANLYFIAKKTGTICPTENIYHWISLEFNGQDKVLELHSLLEGCVDSTFLDANSQAMLNDLRVRLSAVYSNN